ncbi:MAG: PD40 domain-containing protein [Pseudonocardiales bacterium]|nr:PD40 domain-containing protein [Pseudonocardiales bacterium]
MSCISDPAVEQASREAGAEVRRLRRDRGWSLAELKEQVHYSKGYLSKIENGQQRITPEMARNFDKVFGTSSVLATLHAAQPSRTPVQDDGEQLGARPCPYPGLAAFGPEEARWFFGRTEVITDLVCRLGQHGDGSGPLAVVAPSGTGKSSLLAAGLIPALADEALPGSSDWRVVCATPGTHPLTTLAERIAVVTGAEPVAVAAVAGDPDWFAAFLTEVAAGGKPEDAPASARIVLIVDQFEEVFTECQQEAERQAFIAALCTAARRAAVVVVLGVRADFYDSCLAYPALLPALQAPVVLGPMSADQIRSIITGPAEAEGLQVEPGLVELLLRDLGVTDDLGAETASYSPGVLPLLAHALRVACQQGEGRALTVAGYRRAGSICHALVSTADRAYSRLSPAEQQLAQQLLLRLVNLGDQGKATRRRLTRTQLIEALSLPAPTVEKVLEVLGQARLVTFHVENLGQDGDHVEITHEALLTAWPQLADWINTDRDGLRTHQRLAEAAEEWQATNRDPSGLYRGTRLAIAREWATSPGCKGRLSAREEAFLTASIDHQHAEQRRTRRLRTLVGVLAMSLVMAPGVVITFQQHQLARADELAIKSSSLVATQPDTAMLSAAEAYHLIELPGIRNALLSAQSHYFVRRLVGHTRHVHTVAFRPDGRILATASDDGTARLWRVASHGQIAKINSTGSINDAEFSSDGRTLATASTDRTVRLWNVTDPSHPTSLGQPLTGAPRTTVDAATFSHDGRILVTASDDGTVRLWGVTIPSHPTPLGPPLTGHTGAVNAVAFSPDDRILATASADGTARLWDVASRGQLAALTGSISSVSSISAVNAVAFSPDGQTLATASTDRTVRLWNVATPSHPTLLGVPLMTGHVDAVNAVAFSPDGHTLVTGSGDGTAQLWDVATQQLAGTLGGHSGAIRGVAFSRDGHTVATVGDDHIVKLWDTSGPIFLSSPPVSSDGVVFSPTGGMLATVHAEGTTGLWDMASHRQITTLTDPTGAISHVAFSLDGRTLATASTNQTVRLWGVTIPSHPTPLGPPLTGHTGAVNAVAFSPDDRILATASADGTGRLWEVASHQTIDTLTGHTGPIRSVAFSPDGRRLATASDETVRLYDISNPYHSENWAILTGHTSDVYRVVFSPDGQTLTTVSKDSTVRLWDLNPDRVTARLCHLIGTVSKEQWAQLYPELPYQTTCP